MNLVFSPLSLRQLHEIQDYIADDNPAAADKVVTRIRQSVEILADFPKLGRIWEDGPTRVLMVSGLPYRIHYRLLEATDIVEIMLILHASRKPPVL
jgi:addiction module RelE/StbE family toxin